MRRNKISIYILKTTVFPKYIEEADIIPFTMEEVKTLINNSTASTKVL